MCVKLIQPVTDASLKEQPGQANNKENQRKTLKISQLIKEVRIHEIVQSR